MDEAEAAVQREGNRHAMLGHGIHIRRDEGQVQLQPVRQAGVEHGVGRENFGKLRGQGYIVIRQADVGMLREESVSRQIEL